MTALLCRDGNLFHVLTRPVAPKRMGHMGEPILIDLFSNAILLRPLAFRAVISAEDRVPDDDQI